eukprot:IDg1223t1
MSCPIMAAQSDMLLCINPIRIICLESTLIRTRCTALHLPPLTLYTNPVTGVVDTTLSHFRTSWRSQSLYLVARPSACASPITIKRRREEMSPSCGSAATEMDASLRVERIRELLRKRGLTAYLVPSEDAHMSEYVATCDRRRHFLTGFTGSAGTALVTLTGAYCWTDGRYFVQAAAEL